MSSGGLMSSIGRGGLGHRPPCPALFFHVLLSVLSFDFALFCTSCIMCLCTRKHMYTDTLHMWTGVCMRTMGYVAVLCINACIHILTTICVYMLIVEGNKNTITYVDRGVHADDGLCSRFMYKCMHTHTYNHMRLHADSRR